MFEGVPTCGLLRSTSARAPSTTPCTSIDSVEWSTSFSHSITGNPFVATEAIVRQWLRDDLLASASTPIEAVYEFWVPRSNERADVAVIGSQMMGFEIKTERDTLKRLPRQIAAYDRLFDRCAVVLAERHVTAAMSIVPEWWGVIAIVTEDGQSFLRSMKSATPNNGVDPQTLVRLLWREEVRVALAALGNEPDPRASRLSMWNDLLDLINLNQLKATVRSAILTRIPTRRFCAAEIST